MSKDPARYELMGKRPPDILRPTQRWEPEALLWWAVIREAARDLRYSHKSNALDALEFLRFTGVWLLTRVFGFDDIDAKSEIARLVLDRNAYHREPLDDNVVRLHRTHSRPSGRRGHYS